MRSPRRQAFRFTRPLAEVPGSLTPHTIRDFTRGISQLLLPRAASLDTRSRNLLTLAANLEFTVVSARTVRVARSNARAAQLISADGLRREIYDRLPDRKADPVVAGILGAAVVGQGNVLTLEMESAELTAEREAAAQAVRDIFQVPEGIGLAPPHDLDLSLGRFEGGVDDAIVEALSDIVLPLAEEGTLAFAPIPNPYEPTQAAPA
jgi:hypothetical protein